MPGFDNPTSKKRRKKVIITPDLHTDYIVLGENIVMLSLEFAKKLIDMPTLDNKIDREKSLTSTESCREIPLYGTTRCGEPIFAQENISGYYAVDASNIINDEEYFYLRAKGDSMIRSHIVDGALVLIKKQPTIDNGQIAAVLVNGEEATLKRVKFLEEAVILYPDNPAHQSKIYKTDEVKILGVVKEIIIKTI